MDDDAVMRRIEQATVGEVERRPVVVVEPDPEWPARYEREAERIRGALGDAVVELHHVGSTSVPDLPAKPIIDIALVVADSADETAYVPALTSAGYTLRIREPDWYEHRVLVRRHDGDVNLHVFGPDCPEVERMLCFRDHLRRDAADRRLYADTKRELAARDWPTVQHYADAKDDVVAAIMQRARATDPPGIA